jgi:translation elongation factor EF-1alpha
MDIDDMIKDQEENEGSVENKEIKQTKSLDYIMDEQQRNVEKSNSDSESKRVLVGKVEHFFSKLNVAAINLTGSLRVGDIIEIENYKDSIKLQVSSMQINKQKVEEATEGDSVGIIVNKPVNPGSKVYVIDMNLDDFR